VRSSHPVYKFLSVFLGRVRVRFWYLDCFAMGVDLFGAFSVSSTVCGKFVFACFFLFAFFLRSLAVLFFFSLSTVTQIQDGETYVVKIAPGSFSGNAQLGLPTNTGLMLVFSSLTGY